jgi:hypothetical protein
MGWSVVEDLEVNRKVETLGATGSALKPTLVIENAVCISVLHQAAQIERNVSGVFLSEGCNSYVTEGSRVAVVRI